MSLRGAEKKPILQCRPLFFRRGGLKTESPVAVISCTTHRRMPCPLCRTRGPFVELKLEWEPAICDDEPEVAFNPCGHIVSERVARKWASLALPDNAPPNARYRPICPFCAKPLKTDTRAGEQPFNRILFQSDNSHDDDDGTASQEGDGSFSTNTPRDRTPTSSDRTRQNTDDLSNAS